MTEFDNTNNPMKNANTVEKSTAGSIIATKVAGQLSGSKRGMAMAAAWLEYKQTPSIGMTKPQPHKWKVITSLACLVLLTFVGSASATLTVTTANQIGTANTYPFTPSWTPDSAHSLINVLAPSFTSGNVNL